uniref:Uncharacterized protein n=1 Tax=Cacopsylla melanoneura TaxID=428564 RepID=A0A8D8X6P1_9HEMI
MQSLLFCMPLNSLKSSAYSKKDEFWTTLPISSMNIINSRQLSFEPCGTDELGMYGCENVLVSCSFLYTTCCFLFFKYVAKNSRILFEKPNLNIFSNRTSWLILS